MQSNWHMENAVKTLPLLPVVCPRGLKRGSWEVWWGSRQHMEEIPDNLGQNEPQHDPEFPGRWWGEWGGSQLITLFRTPPMLLPPTTSLRYLGILGGKTQSCHKCESRRGQNCAKCLLNLHCVKPPFKLLWQHIDPPGPLRGLELCRSIDRLCRFTLLCLDELSVSWYKTMTTTPHLFYISCRYEPESLWGR